MQQILQIIKRDLRLSWRRGTETIVALFFFVIAASMFPFALGPDIGLLRDISGGIIWVSALLACLMTIDHLFIGDFEDGTFDNLALSPIDFEQMVIAKTITHWLLTGLPIILACPVLAVLLSMPFGSVPILALSLLLGSLFMSHIGALGACLILGARHAGVLLALLVLPLYIPVLIFGVSMINADMMDQNIQTGLSFMMALNIIAIAVTPFAGAACLKQAIQGKG